MAFAKGTAPKRTHRRRTFWPWLEALENRTTPTTIRLTTSADNTLYQVPSSDPAQQLSDGAGPTFFVGDTNQPTDYVRRGLIEFNLSGVPEGSTVTSATLTLHVSKAVSAVSQNIALNGALDAWGRVLPSHPEEVEEEGWERRRLPAMPPGITRFIPRRPGTPREAILPRPPARPPRSTGPASSRGRDRV